MKSHEAHRLRADQRGAPVCCAVITTSDTRTSEDDRTGMEARRLLEAAGHRVVMHSIVPNDETRIAEAIQAGLDAGADLVLLSGGTGVGPRDRTVDVAERMSSRSLPGFGELFRVLSYREIGTAAILSRAFLGVTNDGRLLGVTPGSTGAMTTALEKVLLPELRHILDQARPH